jgi:hypothetical protein
MPPRGGCGRPRVATTTWLGSTPSSGTVVRSGRMPAACGPGEMITASPEAVSSNLSARDSARGPSGAGRCARWHSRQGRRGSGAAEARQWLVGDVIEGHRLLAGQPVAHRHHEDPGRPRPAPPPHPAPPTCPAPPASARPGPARRIFPACRPRRSCSPSVRRSAAGVLDGKRRSTVLSVHNPRQAAGTPGRLVTGYAPGISPGGRIRPGTRPRNPATPTARPATTTFAE